MKKYRKFLIVLFTAIIFSCLFVFMITNSYSEHKTDILPLNNIVQTIKENWNDIKAIENEFADTEMLIFNSDDFIIYSSSADKLEGINSPSEAIHKSCICMTISDGNKYLGTVVIPDPEKTENEKIKIRLFSAAAAISIIMLVVALVLELYVKNNIIKPFRKMKQFAGNIAQGRLDEPLMMEKNNMFGAFTESFDIMREELKESQRREKILKLKEKELVASLSHDLKTPVTGIKLICELLLVKTEDSYVKEKIENINQKAEQINILVSDLLSSALDDLYEITVSCKDEVSGILHGLVSENDTRLLAAEEQIPECIICVDKLRLSQIIGNIISNSYKYADTKIDIGYRINGSYLEMKIRDYGDGVSEDEINLITNKFYRGKINSAGKDGCGLGLYISSELMTSMSGQLICSCREKGLMVTLMIPLS